MLLLDTVQLERSKIHMPMSLENGTVVPLGSAPALAPKSLLLIWVTVPALKIRMPPLTKGPDSARLPVMLLLVMLPPEPSPFWTAPISTPYCRMGLPTPLPVMLLPLIVPVDPLTIATPALP